MRKTALAETRGGFVRPETSLAATLGWERVVVRPETSLAATLGWERVVVRPETSASATLLPEQTYPIAIHAAPTAIDAPLTVASMARCARGVVPTKRVAIHATTPAKPAIAATVPTPNATM